MVLPLPPGLVIARLAPGDAQPLGTFFEMLGADAETARFFHPHPLTQDFAARLCARAGTTLDRSYATRYRGRLAAYHRLSGWDEGYAVPSFGVCVHPALRGVGLGQTLLAQAILDSHAAGAPALRLTVYKENRRAVHVYRKFGFTFTDKNDRELVGMLDLAPVPPLPLRPLPVAGLDAWASAQARAA
jgi:GNAT superfamily N-acetyltransferase